MTDAPHTDNGALFDARYGAPQPSLTLRRDDGGTIQTLIGHRSVRAFDPRPIDDDIIDTVIAAAQSASTSSNLQAWSVIVLRDPEHKAAAATLAGDQQFIRDAPLFLVFVADWARNVEIARRRSEPDEGVEYLDSTLVGAIDAAIAAQNAIVAAEALGLGAVFVGAVRNHPQELSELLDLPRASFPAVGVALGWPNPERAGQVKPRLPQSVVRHEERYRAADAEEIAAYDELLRAFTSRSGRTPRSWSDAVTTRVRSRDALHGRDALSEVLSARGLPSR